MPARRPTSPHAGARGGPDGTTTASDLDAGRGVPSPREAAAAARARTSPARSSTSRGPRVPTGRSGARGASTRPATRTPTGAASRGAEVTAEPPARIPRMFTVRAMVLFVVLMMAFVLLFPTVRAHLAQQAENRRLAAEVAAARDRTAELDDQLDRWQDPAYVAAQARERLGFVRPGETAYRVVDPQIVPDPTAPAVPAAGTGPALVPDGTTEPWYATIWESVRVAGEAPVADPQGADVPAAPLVTPAPGDAPAGDPAAPATPGPGTFAPGTPAPGTPAPGTPTPGAPAGEGTVPGDAAGDGTP